MIVLDTNVLSEFTRPTPSAKVLNWLAAIPRTDLYTSAITQAELQLGVELLPEGKKRTAIGREIERLLSETISGRVLAFDGKAAREYSLLAAFRRRLGRPIDELDAQIAAIARAHGFALATRNVRDFEHCGVELLNPWGE